MKSILTKLNKIQSELKAPKGQWNKFGSYNYRSCEDILEAAKPHLDKNNCSLIVKDEIEHISDRFYVKATATIYCTETGENIETSAFAREPLAKKGMDEAQITGATSSYARKYALNGLLAIDDTRDSDATNTHEKEKKATKKEEAKENVSWKDKLVELGNEKGYTAVELMKTLGIPRGVSDEECKKYHDLILGGALDEKQ